jgi:hypothetical protein
VNELVDFLTELSKLSDVNEMRLNPKPMVPAPKSAPLPSFAVKQGFATSQFSGVLGFGPFPAASMIPAWREPPLRKQSRVPVINRPPMVAPTSARTPTWRHRPANYSPARVQRRPLDSRRRARASPNSRSPEASGYRCLDSPRSRCHRRTSGFWAAQGSGHWQVASPAEPRQTKAMVLVGQ